MRPWPLGLALTTLLAACGPKLPAGVDEAGLAVAIEQRIGDPATCVILADEKGREVWKLGENAACRAAYSVCDGSGDATVRDMVDRAATGAVVQTGCDSVSWAAGPVGDSRLVYGAVMFGARALPGIEIARRLDTVFRESGL